MFLQIEFCFEAWGRDPVLTLGVEVRRATHENKREPCLGLACKTQGCAFHQPLAPNPGGMLLPAGPRASLFLWVADIPSAKQGPRPILGRGGRANESSGGGDGLGPGRVCPCAPAPTLPPFLSAEPRSRRASGPGGARRATLAFCYLPGAKPTSATCGRGGRGRGRPAFPLHAPSFTPGLGLGPPPSSSL